MINVSKLEKGNTVKILIANEGMALKAGDILTVEKTGHSSWDEMDYAYCKTTKGYMVEIMKNASDIYVNSPERKRAGRQIVILRQYISYMQAGAKEKYLKKDLEVLERRLDIIEKGFGKWLSYNKEFDQLKSPQAKYNSIMETSKVKRQIKALKYLLQI